MAAGTLTLALSGSATESYAWYLAMVVIWLVGAVWAFRSNR